MNNFRLVKHFLLRRAGFPFHLLEMLETPLSGSLAEHVIRSEVEADQLRSRLLSEGFSTEVARNATLGNRDQLRVLSRLRHCIGHNREPAQDDINAYLDSETLGPLLTRWVACRQQSQQARSQLERSIRSDQLATRLQLKNLLNRRDVQEAIFLLSPDFFEAIDRWSHSPLQESSTSKQRAFEQRLFLFLQRLASKNETTSFFGPLTYGSISQDIIRWTLGPETKEGSVERKVFAAFWAVAALGRAACRESSLRRTLPIRRLGLASIRGQTAYTAAGQRIEVNANTAKLFHAITEHATTIGKLATELDLSIEECEKIVDWLERQGLVRRDLEPASTDAQPLAELRSRLPEGNTGDHWRDVFDKFCYLLQSFAGATLSERRDLLPRIEAMFRDTTGVEPRRAAGHMYADRQIFYEDCAGDMQPVLCPASEANRIEQELAPILRLGAAYGELRHRAIRTLATRVMKKIGSPVPLLVFAQAINQPTCHEELQDLLEPARVFVERLRQHLVPVTDDQTPGSKVARLSTEDINNLIEIEPTARAVSLDLMLERRPNMPPQIVLGEAHPYVFAWGSQAYFAPHKSDVLATFAHDLAPWGGREHMATVLRRRQHKGLVSNDFPGRFIEVSGYANVPPERRIAIADVMVVPSETGPVLKAPDGKELSLYVSENDHLHLLCFAPAQVEMPLIRCGTDTPRILISDVVYQRRRWELPEKALASLASAKSPADLAVEIARQQMTVGWPRHLFAKGSSEPKPICLDLNVPFAHMILQKLLQKGALTLVEMLPRPQALWLQRQAGSHTSELRVQFVL